MPAQRVRVGARVGYRWGARGRIYFYTAGDAQDRARAKALAERQGAAIHATKKTR